MNCPYCQQIMLGHNSTTHTTNNTMYYCFWDTAHNFIYSKELNYIKLIVNNCILEKIDKTVLFNGHKVMTELDINQFNILNRLNQLALMKAFL